MMVQEFGVSVSRFASNKNGNLCKWNGNFRSNHSERKKWSTCTSGGCLFVPENYHLNRAFPHISGWTGNLTYWKAPQLSIISSCTVIILGTQITALVLVHVPVSEESHDCVVLQIPQQ